MRMLSYHTKMRLRKVFTVLGILALVALLLWICWLVWLQRFIVYTRDGVVFNFDRSTTNLSGKEEGQVQPGETVALDISLAETVEETPTGLQPLAGFYADSELLSEEFEALQAQLEALEPGTAVLLDVKSKFGNFYYTTGLTGASQSTAVDAGAMDSLIRTLRQKDLYLIARVPAFRDSAFAQANLSCGLAVASGALWTDEDQCYWLDPANTQVMRNLIQLCRELRNLGFDEVVFTDFRIPDSGSIVYSASSSKDQIIRDAAAQLVTACASDQFTVSFQASSGFQLPEGQCRLYLENVAPEQAAATASGAAVGDSARLVFLTDTRDTRFDEYSVLRRIL